MIDKQKLVKIMGAGNVAYDQEALETYSRDISFVNQVRPACVVKPRKGDDVQKLINLANETKTALVPVPGRYRSGYRRGRYSRPQPDEQGDIC